MIYDLIYEPDEDSYLIAEELKKFHNIKVLDLGTGSGYLAEIAIKNNCEVSAADINAAAADFCLRKGIKTVRSNLFSSIKEKFDLIAFNPPYLPLDADEPKDSMITTTGGIKGNEIIERFLKQAKNYLYKNGKILIVFSSISGDVINLFKKYSYKYKKLSEKKVFFETLYVYLIKI